MNIVRLSIILPFYNVESYIADCLDSLYAQDIPEEEYEVICVDDCSPDHSIRIVQKYQKQHPNLVLIEHDENKCLGGARNSGIRAAKGKYLWFIDSDDMVHPNCLKELLTLCEKDELDVLMFNFEKINISGNVIKDEAVFSDTNVYSGIEYIKNIWGDEFVYHLGFVWRQIYRTNFLKSNSIFFPEHVFWEDTVFMPKALFYAHKVRSVSDVFYKYRVNPSSVSGVYNKDLKADLIFQFAFNTGKDLLYFSKEIEEKDEKIAKNLNIKARWYINSFIFKLLKAPVQQKKQFFMLIKSNNSLVNQLKPYMTGLNKVLCGVSFGYSLCLILTPIYELKSRLKNKI